MPLDWRHSQWKHRTYPWAGRWTRHRGRRDQESPWRAMPQGPPVRARWPWLPSPTQLAWYRWTLTTPKPRKSPTDQFAVLTALCVTWAVYSLQAQLIQEVSGGSSLRGIFVGLLSSQAWKPLFWSLKWSSVFGLRNSSIGNTWELVGDANPWAFPNRWFKNSGRRAELEHAF